MQIKIPKRIKSKIKAERDKTFVEMSKPNLPKDEWEELNKKYKAYDEMLKPTWKISPDTLLVVLGNLLGIVLVLKHEQLDIITSKAFGLILKGRV